MFSLITPNLLNSFFREVYRDDYPEEANPDSFVTITSYSIITLSAHLIYMISINQFLFNKVNLTKNILKLLLTPNIPLQ